jgi:hypothetical protein
LEKPKYFTQSAHSCGENVPSVIAISFQILAARFGLAADWFGVLGEKREPSRRTVVAKVVNSEFKGEAVRTADRHDGGLPLLRALIFHAGSTDTNPGAVHGT